MIARVALAALAAALALPTAPPARPRTAVPPATTRRPALDDPTIVGIFDAANTWDIETGSLAAKKGKRADVREFGAMLARDHAAVRTQGRTLAGKLHVTPVPVAADFALKADHAKAMQQLGALSGDAFDRAFLAHEAAYHKAVIAAVTTSFLPAIANAELRAFVEQVAPAFAAHQAKAEALQHP